MSDRKEIFQFKQFSVSHAKSAMKVGTDGVLLGAWVKNAGEKRILDVGTGTGLVALMLAQRFLDASIQAIDIDKASIVEARSNFSDSPWSQRLNAEHTSLQQYVRKREFFDLVVSNPPYFSNGTTSPNRTRHRARHSEALSHAEIICLTEKLLNPEGKLTVIIPAFCQKEFVYCARQCDLHLQKVLNFKPKSSKTIERVILQVGRIEGTVAEDELVQYDHDGAWSARYKELTRDYYLKL